MIADALATRSVSRYLAALPYPPDEATLHTYLQFLCSSGQASRTMELNGAFAGIVTLSSQLTFWVVCKFWRKGLASRSIDWLAENYFSKPVDLPIKAEVHTANEASLALLTRKGFERSGSNKRRFSFVTETAEEFVPLLLSRSAWQIHKEGD
ncbi:hypothetical protein CLV41_10545 [Roseibium marinum]|uniref:N-acetyltransferase domain-containing protein n=2 Tax=Roseibium marinum TaxID=281252 RepID=A0A2S3UT14_9HYPH|nr:hypothetical protein CLV41_10545 [Roseibium marinum]